MHFDRRVPWNKAINEVEKGDLHAPIDIIMEATLPAAKGHLDTRVIGKVLEEGHFSIQLDILILRSFYGVFDGLVPQSFRFFSSMPAMSHLSTIKQWL